MLQMGNNTGIEVPADVVAALGSGKRPAVVVNVNGYEYRSTVASGAAAAWDELAYTHRKEHVRAMLDAKKTDARARRIAAVISKLEG